MGIKEEIAKQKELLYLNALKVANNTLQDAEEIGEEVSSGLLSAASQLLKLNVDSVLPTENVNSLFGAQLKELIEDAKEKN